MVDPLILLLFVVSGAAAGWMGIHLLPDGLVSATTNAEQLRLQLSGAGGGIGLIAGLVFKKLRGSTKFIFRRQLFSSRTGIFFCFAS